MTHLPSVSQQKDTRIRANKKNTVRALVDLIDLMIGINFEVVVGDGGRRLWLEKGAAMVWFR